MNQQLSVFLVLLRSLQKIDPEFPLQYAICLGEIAINEGLSLTELSTKTGMPLSTISRIVGALSRQRQRGTAYELVHVTVSAKERRRKELHLTDRGRAVLQDIADILTNSADQRLHP